MEPYQTYAWIRKYDKLLHGSLSSFLFYFFKYEVDDATTRFCKLGKTLKVQVDALYRRQ